MWNSREEDSENESFLSDGIDNAHCHRHLTVFITDWPKVFGEEINGFRPAVGDGVGFNFLAINEVRLLAGWLSSIILQLYVSFYHNSIFN